MKVGLGRLNRKGDKGRPHSMLLSNQRGEALTNLFKEGKGR